MFTCTDRGKFFDYILPVVDGSNVYDQWLPLLTYINPQPEQPVLDEYFLKQLSLYRHAMRLIKNITNEFLIYFNILNNIKLDTNKMLAMVRYKNLFPKDYSDLWIRTELVFTLLAKNNAFRQSKITMLEDGLATEPEPNISVAEKIARENFIRVKIQHFKDDPLRQWLSEYAAVYDLDKIFENRAAWENGQAVNFDAIKHSEYFAILKYLLRQGYIDENYANYMTYFYGYGLASDDIAFLHSIIHQTPKHYNYPLKDVAKILPYLSESNFRQAAILNFDLFNFLLEQRSLMPDG